MVVKRKPRNLLYKMNILNAAPPLGLHHVPNYCFWPILLNTHVLVCQCKNNRQNNVCYCKFANVVCYPKTFCTKLNRSIEIATFCSSVLLRKNYECFGTKIHWHAFSTCSLRNWKSFRLCSSCQTVFFKELYTYTRKACDYYYK